jgi:pentose-5-phosphate-3-epimerase
MQQAVAKIRELRRLKPDLHISVDGGVSEKNAAELIEAGANVLVPLIGSRRVRLLRWRDKPHSVSASFGISQSFYYIMT